VDGSYQSGALAADACALEEVLRGKDQSVVIGHDWGALAAYGAAGLAPERFRKVVTMALPPVAAAGATFFTYDQIKRSFYIFFFQLPFAEAAVAMDDLAFIDRLWADWSPGYDASWDVAKCKEAIGNPENLTAALSYYRATFDPSTHVAQYEEAQQASAGIPPQPTLYLHGERDGCIKTGPISDVEALLSGGSRAEMIESAGHFLHLEQPGRVEELVLEFLKP
jgi:pimeloyl-ACP methyl ester carboxylesterase